MSDFTFNQALNKLRQFTKDRGWGKCHKPKDLILKLMEEVGELSEHFQWQSDQEILSALQDEQKKQAVSDELIDVLVVVLMLMDKIEVDIQNAFESKINKNQEKYPVDEGL